MNWVQKLAEAPCPECKGKVGRLIVVGINSGDPNGQPEWEDCSTCHGTGDKYRGLSEHPGGQSLTK